MWRLFNWLFGWDYIYWKNSSAQGVARIIELPSGLVGYWQYRSISVFQIICNPDQIIWLTCKSEKYFK